jgi:PPOX class probable F420-dependent enzyme
MDRHRLRVPHIEASGEWSDALSGVMDNLYRRVRHRDAALIGDGFASAGDFVDFANHSYCLVATYRKNGETVPTPVWFALQHEALCFRTAAGSLKIKRIRVNPSVRIAACNARGRPARPVKVLAGEASVLEGEEVAAAEALLEVKYGRRRAMYSKRVFGGPWEYVLVSPGVLLSTSVVGDARRAAVRLAGAAIELETVLGRIKAAHPSPSPVALAVDEGLAELRVYAQAPQLLAPTVKRRSERTKLIEQLERSVALVKRIRHCEAWYSGGIMESDDGQRLLHLSETICSDALSLPYWMGELDRRPTEQDCP